jgi:hypothetical protein
MALTGVLNQLLDVFPVEHLEEIGVRHAFVEA